MNSMKSPRVLKLLLRLVGVSALFALGAVAMPMAWMATIHRGLGLGEMPQGAIVEYLARSLSAFYALFGVVCLALAHDVEQHRAAISLGGLLLAIFGAIMLGIDMAAGMPWDWTISEGPLTILMGGLLRWLAR
jgi:hypothetical protein